MANVHIELTNGFQTDIDPIVLDDLEVIEMLADIEDGNPLAFPRVSKKLLGQDGHRKLCDLLREKDGRVPTEAFGTELTEVIRQLGENEQTKK